MRSFTFSLSSWRRFSIRARLNFERTGKSIEFCARDCAKTHAVAGSQESRRICVWIEQTQWRSPDYIPASGRFERINASLPASDCYRTSWHGSAWRGEPRDVQLLWQTEQVRKARQETHASGNVLRGRM